MAGTLIVSLDFELFWGMLDCSTLDAYVNYVETYYKGMAYYYDYCEKIDPTDEEIKACFEENKDSYANIDMSEKYIDVRHVLLQPEDGEPGADG